MSLVLSAIHSPSSENGSSEQSGSLEGRDVRCCGCACGPDRLFRIFYLTLIVMGGLLHFIAPPAGGILLLIGLVSLSAHLQVSFETP